MSQKVERIGPVLLGHTLGQGTTGKVRLGIHQKTGEKVAIKIIRKDKLVSSAVLRTKIEREVAILKLVDHPYVLHLYEVVETDHHLFLILEYASGGELFDYIVGQGRLTPAEAHRFFRQIVSGLRFCHSLNICHRDLKPENILLDDQQNVKLADFGMASLMKEGNLLDSSCGSPHYASPEIVRGQKYNGMASDVWSLGVVLYALLTGKLPFDDDNMKRLLTKVREGRFVIPSHVSEDAGDLIKKMLTVSVDERISLEQVVKHPWYVRLMPKNNAEPLDHGLASLAVDPMDVIKDPRPVVDSTDTADPIVISNLQFLGWTEDGLSTALTSHQPCMQKVYYRLLEKWLKREDHLYQDLTISADLEEPKDEHKATSLHPRTADHHQRPDALGPVAGNSPPREGSPAKFSPCWLLHEAAQSGWKEVATSAAFTAPEDMLPSFNSNSSTSSTCSTSSSVTASSGSSSHSAASSVHNTPSLSASAESASGSVSASGTAYLSRPSPVTTHNCSPTVTRCSSPSSWGRHSPRAHAPRPAYESTLTASQALLQDALHKSPIRAEHSFHKARPAYPAAFPRPSPPAPHAPPSTLPSSPATSSPVASARRPLRPTETGLAGPLPTYSVTPLDEIRPCAKEADQRRKDDSPNAVHAFVVQQAIAHPSKWGLIKRILRK